MNKLLIFLYVLWFVLNIIDAGLTQCALSHGFQEANPVPKWIIDHSGWTAAWMFKIFMSLLFLFFVNRIEDYFWKWKYGCIIVGCLTLSAVVASNSYQLYSCLADGC